MRRDGAGLRAAALALGLVGCAQPGAAPPYAPAGEPTVEIAAAQGSAPAVGDGEARLTLAFRMADGSRRPIAGEALSVTAFRGGAALVEPSLRLVLVSPDGERSVLAQRSGAPPRRGPRGELIYVARYGLGDELHELAPGGRDRILASGLRGAGLLAPQPDGRLVFAAVNAGGVAGLWLHDRSGPRCLTNCELVAGRPWGDRYLPLPTGAATIRIEGDRVAWDGPDGTRRSTRVDGADSAPRVEAAGAGAPAALGSAP